MKKTCIACGLERDAEADFSWEYKAQGKRQRRCKNCQSELSKKHYQNNKAAYYARSSALKARIQEENAFHISTYLSIHPCVDCGQADIRVLEFDHVNGQKFRGIASLFCWGCNWSVIEAEIAKCEIRCA